MYINPIVDVLGMVRFNHGDGEATRGGAMKKGIVGILAVVFFLEMWGSVDASIIDFDDMEGMSGPFYVGQPVPWQYVVDDEYLSRGVLFDSGGGGIRVARAGNAISRLNLASGTANDPQQGPVSDYDACVRASFWVDGSQGLVDMAGLTVSNFNGSGVLEARNLNGSLLGSVSSQQSPFLFLSFPGQIHSVIFIPKNATFDNFTFEGLNKVPIPGALWLLGTGLIGLFGIHRKLKK